MMIKGPKMIPTPSMVK